MIVIDGSEGEGGGQVLRTALSLSMITGRPFRMFRIRAHRAKPGLRRQHLTAVRAAQAVSSAVVDNAVVGASEIAFFPHELTPGNYCFDVGTAGSTTLVAQTLIPALVLANAGSRINLQGGTHNPMCPPFEFLDRSYLPVLESMGARVRAELLRPGYYPAGGGVMELVVTPTRRLSPVDLSSRGLLLHKEVHATVSNLPLSIAHRELAEMLSELGWPPHVAHAHDETRSKGPGNVLLVVLRFEQITSVFAGFGRRGVSAEQVARGVARKVADYLGSAAVVEPHLADQLLVPFALAGRGRFITLRPSKHALTNMHIIEMFLPVRFGIEKVNQLSWSINLRDTD